MSANAIGSIESSSATASMSVESTRNESSMAVVPLRSDDDDDKKISFAAFHVEISSEARSVQMRGDFHQGTSVNMVENNVYNASGRMAGEGALFAGSGVDGSAGSSGSSGSCGSGGGGGAGA